MKNRVVILNEETCNKSVDTIELIPDAFFHPFYEKLKMYYVKAAEGITGQLKESNQMLWVEN
ncbi:MAG: hypothetical protein PHE09_11455 [Oscillospiraceae bacterium]|nr:hypothetical protein [Oscillospiraceae bacterium]